MDIVFNRVMSCLVRNGFWMNDYRFFCFGVGEVVIWFCFFRFINRENIITLLCNIKLVKYFVVSFVWVLVLEVS